MPDERSRDETAKLRDVALPPGLAEVTRVALANGGTGVIQGRYNNSVAFVGYEDGIAIFILSDSGTVYEISDPLGVFSAVFGTAASMNVYYDGGSWKIQNLRGGSRTVFSIVFRLAAAP